MKQLLKYGVWVLLLVVFIYAINHYIQHKNPNPKYVIGQKLDSLNGVYVYYNGRVGHTGKRNLTSDGYNIGLRYQCVEFVKRYYYQYYHHLMPDSYGHAKDFFDDTIPDGKLNVRRNLIQYINPSSTPPKVGDLLIFDGHSGNQYGHVAIVSQVDSHKIQIIQQNPGAFAKARINIDWKRENQLCVINHERILGWLRKE